MKTAKFIIPLLSAAFIFSSCSGGSGNLNSSENPVSSNSFSESDSAPETSQTDESSENAHETSENSYTLHKPAAGEKTLSNLLLTAKTPVGHTMYVWGGGWNEEDTGAGIDATRLGANPHWAQFEAQQTADYDFNDTYFQIHDGLDCSGYIGWLIYNVFETENGKDGYVCKAYKMAQTFADNGWGEYTSSENVSEWKPGDIMSMSGHVWLSLGMCRDGSVVLMHSSPPGVRICGTKLDGNESDAIRLAQKYMSEFYPEWFARFPECSVDDDYLSSSNRFRFSDKTLSDNENLREMTAQEILEWLYS